MRRSWAYSSVCSGSFRWWWPRLSQDEPFVATLVFEAGWTDSLPPPPPSPLLPPPVTSLPFPPSAGLKSSSSTGLWGGVVGGVRPDGGGKRYPHEQDTNCARQDTGQEKNSTWKFYSRCNMLIIESQATGSLECQVSVGPPDRDILRLTAGRTSRECWHVVSPEWAERGPR